MAQVAFGPDQQDLKYHVTRFLSLLASLPRTIGETQKNGISDKVIKSETTMDCLYRKAKTLFSDVYKEEWASMLNVSFEVFRMLEHHRELFLTPAILELVHLSFPHNNIDVTSGESVEHNALTRSLRCSSWPRFLFG
jgi:hypothetical protein